MSSSCRDIDEEAITSIEENQFSFDVFPNPTSGIVTLELETGISTEAKILIRDITGREVYNDQIGLNEGLNPKQINLDYLKPAVYLLSVIVNDQVFTKRIIVE